MLAFEYVWVDPQGGIRSKMRTVSDINSLNPKDIPLWNFDGSSTGHVDAGGNTEIILIPVRVYKPLAGSIYYIILCKLGSRRSKGRFDPVCTRHLAEDIHSKTESLKPWFALEQEYFIVDGTVTDIDQGNFYCSTDYKYVPYRELVERHYKACLDIGVKIAGFNAEVAPNQWEFQIGPCDILQASDDLIVARYLLNRIAAEYKVSITYDPKPLLGDWNGSGCHINFSTKQMREEGGYEHILTAIDNLKGGDHKKMVKKYYGSGNELRLTGEHETSSMDEFTWGIGTRHTSIRIPNTVHDNECGYFEDRRPASNIDPYWALSAFLKHVIRTPE